MNSEIKIKKEINFIFNNHLPIHDFNSMINQHDLSYNLHNQPNQPHLPHHLRRKSDSKGSC